MTMPFWPKTDRQRLSKLWATAEAAARAASLPPGFVRVYDAGVTFEVPDLTTDPAEPTLFATWGWRGDAQEAASLDKDAAPTRRLYVASRFFCQRAHIRGNAAGYLETAGEEFWRELQDASVSGLGPIVTQLMSWEQLALFDEEWMEARLDFNMLSTG